MIELAPANTNCERCRQEIGPAQRTVRLGLSDRRVHEACAAFLSKPLEAVKEEEMQAALAAINNRVAVEETFTTICQECGHSWPRKVRIYPGISGGRTEEQQRADAKKVWCGACNAEEAALRHDKAAIACRARASKLRAQQERALVRRLAKGKS